MAMRGNRGLDSSEREQQMVPAHEMEQIQEPDRRNLQLCFESHLPESFFTGKKVEGQLGELICVKLIDTSTGHVVASGPLSSLKLDVVVLRGDFKNEDDDVQTWENFKSHVVKELEGKGPLLAGDLQVSLKEGVGSLGGLKFTDNSSWTQSRKFKLGLKVASGFYEGIRVHEAITDAFKVKDRRGISYKKRDLPKLDDYVWRLKNIGKNGAFHKKLNKADIKTVREFLWKLGTDDQGLKKILGSSMSGRMWDALVQHAKTCDLRGKHYVYYADNTKNFGVVFKSICELSGYIAGGKYYSAENLSDSQKVFVDTLKKEAYAKWKDIVEYDGLEMNLGRRAHSSQTDAVGPESCPSDTDQRVSPAFLTHVAPQPGLVNPGPAVGDNPDSFHPQASFQPFRVPSGQNFVNYIDPPVFPAFLTPPVAPPEPVLVNPGLGIGAPVPYQTPSVPAGEASENLMWDFDDPISRFLQDVDSIDLTSLFQQELSEKADGNTSLDALWREVDRSDSHLPGSSLDPPEQAGGNTVLSVGAHGGHERGGGSNLPRMTRAPIPPRRGKVKFYLGIKIVKFLEGGNTSSPLSEREGIREMASLDSKFEGLSVA